MGRKRLAAVVSRRTTQYRWMWDNRQWFADQLAEARPPNWDKIAFEMAAMGLTNRAGEAPTRSGTRQTWTRVIKDWDAARERAAVRPSATGISPPAPPPPQHNPLVQPIEEPREDEFTFKQVRFPPTGKG